MANEPSDDEPSDDELPGKTPELIFHSHPLARLGVILEAGNTVICGEPIFAQTKRRDPQGALPLRAEAKWAKNSRTRGKGVFGKTPSWGPRIGFRGDLNAIGYRARREISHFRTA